MAVFLSNVTFSVISIALTTVTTAAPRLFNVSLKIQSCSSNKTLYKCQGHELDSQKTHIQIQFVCNECYFEKIICQMCQCKVNIYDVSF